jgi:hypothetical protein
MRVVPISVFGLETVQEVSARKGDGWSIRAVQNWINAGLLPVVVVGAGRSAKFLLRTRDVNKFAPPGRGTKPASKPAPARKPRKEK